MREQAPVPKKKKKQLENISDTQKNDVVWYHWKTLLSIESNHVIEEPHLKNTEVKKNLEKMISTLFALETLLHKFRLIRKSLNGDM